VRIHRLPLVGVPRDHGLDRREGIMLIGRDADRVTVADQGKSRIDQAAERHQVTDAVPEVATVAEGCRQDERGLRNGYGPELDEAVNPLRGHPEVSRMLDPVTPLTG